MEQQSRKLILHFDVNKTIVMKDTASNKPSEESTVCFTFLRVPYLNQIADIIGETAWGRIEQREKEGGMTNIWICAVDILSLDPPGENLISYK